MALLKTIFCKLGLSLGKNQRYLIGRQQRFCNVPFLEASLVEESLL
jgi:hypothetical protein